MDKKLNYLKRVSMICTFLMCLLVYSTSFATTLNTFEAKTDISNLKSWTITLNSEIDEDSISSKSIKITDSNGNIVTTTTSISDDKQSLIIDPPIQGYIPNSTYSLDINENLKSITGASLASDTTMEFTTKNKFEDTSDFSNLPTISTFNISEEPVVENDTLTIELTSDTDDKVQYRIYLYEYPNSVFDATYKYTNVDYIELTNGFTSPTKGTSTYTFSSDKKLDVGKYKILVYVRSAYEEGAHSNTYTDYDNFYSSYLRVSTENSIENPTSNETYTFVKSSKTLAQAVNIQYTKGLPCNDSGSSWVYVTPSIISYYMNPMNFIDDYGKYMFLDLTYMDGILADDLDNVLSDKGILDGQGQSFIDASEENNINPIYLVSHALLETGNGASTLASGVLVSEVDGEEVEPKVVYNLFGIGAGDGDAVKLGSERAYEEGWFSIEEALSGGAYYIGASYINNSTYNQNTLYKMRWYTENDWAYPQYSTDIAWAYKQIKYIKTLFDEIDSGNPVFEIPVYK
jgi:mannosyl-glycoprotein endo-beta-N-acetylglucosaminidase